MRSIPGKAALSALAALLAGLVLASCGDTGKDSQFSPVALAGGTAAGASDEQTREQLEERLPEGLDPSDGPSDSDSDDGDGPEMPTTPTPTYSSPTYSSPTYSSPTYSSPTYSAPSTDPDELTDRAKEACEQQVERARELGGEDAAERVQKICDTID